MLDFVRTHAKSWLVKVALGLIVIVFIFWGGYSYQGRHETEVAQVGDKYISVGEFQTAYENMRENYRRQLGPAFTEDLVRKLDLKKQTLEALINQALVIQGAEGLGLTASTEEIRKRILEFPIFANEGRFDKNRYEAFLRQQRTSPEIFERQVADEITYRKVEAFIKNRAVVGQDEILADRHFNHDKIRLAYIPFDPKPLEDQVAVDDASLQSFYGTHQVKYMEPEKREIAYVFINSEELGKDIPVSDDDVKRYYDDHLDKYKHEKEVRARHILITIKPAGATEKDIETARALAQKALDEAKKGQDFAELAKKYSQDPGSAPKGGDLGYFEKKKMVPEFSEAAFALKKGQISGLVKTNYGFHIIKVEDIREARTVPFDEVKADIAKQLKTQAAQDLAFKKAREFRDLAYARKDIDKAAQEMKLGQATSTWIEMKGEQPDAAQFNQQIKAKLFELSQGDVSDSFELPGKFMVAQVKTIKMPVATPFEQAKDKVTKDYRAEQAKVLIQKKAADVLKAAVEKKSLADAAKQFNLSVRQSEWFSRQDPDKDLKLLRGEGLSKVFGLDESKPFPDAPLELGNRFVICQLLERTPAAAPTPEETAEISNRLLKQKQETAWLTWVTELRKHTKIEKFKDV